jgi:hypothetical protein
MSSKNFHVAKAPPEIRDQNEIDTRTAEIPYQIPIGKIVEINC